MSSSALLYAIAIFLGSTLLFLVEPMAGKRLTPLLGGSAAVWTTCLVFFQTALLMGYLCAHGIASRLKPRIQALVYLAMLGGSLVQVIFNLNPDLHSSTAHPIRSVFLVLSSLIGLPFLTLSATNPLLQSWYARGFGSGASGTVAATPPYRLFALSNFGSLLGLVLYPWLIEPRFTLHAQAVAWLCGFLVFAIVCGLILLRLLRHASQMKAEPTPTQSTDVTTQLSVAAPPSSADRLLWIGLAACGSVLLCAVTNHISQNIAAIPLMWILPLTLYLLTFVLAFNDRQKTKSFFTVQIPGLGITIGRFMLMGFLAIAVGGMGFVIYDTRWSFPFQLSIAFFCLALFVACLFCHKELHRLRPAPQYATSYYLWIATGGALGSVFVGIMAPVVFSGNYELAWGLVFTSALAVAISMRLPVGWRIFWVATTLAMIAVVYFQVKESKRHTVARTRSFYGTLRVTESLEPPNNGVTRTLLNGTIKHGVQVFTDAKRREPMSYYAHDSGVGLAIDHCCGDRPRRIGVIGLGAGTVAAYGKLGDVIRFYDINPQVVQISDSLFTYRKESGARIEIVVGDARVSLAAEPPQEYDVLVVDAFSGDAIPVHLMTREAIALYRRHLKPDGILAVHVSSQYLDLPPVVLQQAKDAGLQAWLVDTEDQEEDGNEEYAADWVLVSANDAFFKLKEVDEATSEITAKPGLRLWTDDYNSLLPLLKYDKLSAFKRYDPED